MLLNKMYNISLIIVGKWPNRFSLSVNNNDPVDQLQASDWVQTRQEDVAIKKPKCLKKQHETD